MSAESLPLTAAPAEGSPPAAPGVRPLRIRHVDSLRAVAAGLVMWAHFKQMIAPKLSAGDPWCLGFLQAVPNAFNLGRIGVLVFFAISGFVICRSFGGTREGGARRFLIRRACRLFPAYWVSMLAGMAVCPLIGQALNWRMVAANVPMIPTVFHQDRVLGVYWTLEIELLFYGLCLALYLARCLERRALLLGLVIALSFLPRTLHVIDHKFGTHLGLSPDDFGLVIDLAVMFWGVLFRLAYDETGGFRRETFRTGGTWLVVVGLLALIDVPDPQIKKWLVGLHTGPTPSHLTVVSALLIFAVWIACLRIDNRVLTYLGVVSYSLYLFHPVPKYVAAEWLAPFLEAHGWNLPLWPYVLACTACTVALAAVVYRWVEHPAIALGKRWAGK